MIAGHTFADTPTGRVCPCGKRWLDVLRDREFWKPGQLGIAHAGALYPHEVEELVREVDRIWATVSPSL